MSIALKQVFNKDKTFRPKRKFEPGTQRFELHKRAQASLNSGVDLRAAVQLPSGEDQNDWVAVHVVDFFNRVNLIYGTICEFCTEQTCPVMSGGPKYEYRWQDDLKYKKPTALPAPQYMNLLMDWIEVQINNEDIFPTCVEIETLTKTPMIFQKDVLGFYDLIDERMTKMYESSKFGKTSGKSLYIVYHVLQCPWSQKRALGSPGTGVTDIGLPMDNPGVVAKDKTEFSGRMDQLNI
ncbi:hypothetical protein STEG23_006364 [Scotinomys teguina]